VLGSKDLKIFAAALFISLSKILISRAAGAIASVAYRIKGRQSDSMLLTKLTQIISDEAGLALLC